jgi:hypothetical protein
LDNEIQNILLFNTNIKMIFAFIIVIIMVIAAYLDKYCAGNRAPRAMARNGASRSKTPYMTFPKEEWEDIQRQLDDRGWCATTRVEQELTKWRDVTIGTEVNSDVGKIRIISKQFLNDALRDHPFRAENEKNPQWIEWTSGKPGVFIRFEWA